MTNRPILVLVLLFCSFSLSSIVFLKMLRLRKIYSSPLIGTTSLTQMVPLFSGLLFFPQNTSAPPLPFFVSDFLQTLLLSLSEAYLSSSRRKIYQGLIFCSTKHSLHPLLLLSFSLPDLHFSVRSSFNTWLQLSSKLADGLLFLIP